MQDNHIKFADRYFETLNASESAIYAGFSSETARQSGYQVLQREDVQEYLANLRKEYQEKSGITKEWVMERFKDISDTSYESADFSSSNKATEMLGKIIGVFEKDNLQKPTATAPIINIISPDAK